jgi:SAM-dependent methyltransferase
MNCIDLIHGRWIFRRRVTRLSALLATVMPEGASVLDVGAGDGSLDSRLLELRPDLKITGIDVLVRPQTSIRIVGFDGQTIPFPDKSFDAVMFVDVLHHANSAARLLKEASRVGRTVVIKDHVKDGLLSGPTLRFMDVVGNARYGVALPYNYWTRQQWDEALRAAQLEISNWMYRLHLYARPLTWVFDRRLHFLACLRPVSN